MEITNEEFKLALSSKNKSIMNLASLPYLRFLSKEELEGCKLIGLWLALQHYDSAKSKFTTYLYNRVKWQCQDALKEVHSDVTTSGNLDCLVDGKFLEDTIEELIQPVDNESQKVISQRFREKMTLEQIGKANKYSRTTAQKRIQKSLKELRKVYE